MARPVGPDPMTRTSQVSSMDDAPSDDDDCDCDVDTVQGLLLLWRVKALDKLRGEGTTKATTPSGTTTKMTLLRGTCTFIVKRGGSGVCQRYTKGAGGESGLGWS